MVLIKRLYTFMLQRFLPLLLMTFMICLFIVLMQFLWKSIDDLVGKGLAISVIGELFFYAALTMVPTALPLAVLLASLMTFGNLGESFELTAMKAAGISLFRIMKPLIWLMIAIAIGAFFFQNNVLPIAQTKMYTLLFSMRQKSPEVEIPERIFYDQIPGMNLYVEKKNQETGMLYDLIIYDVSRGLDNSRVILADSGKLNFTEDKTRLFLHLYQGEMFENLKDNAIGNPSQRYLPFRRESFDDKQIYFIFDANFNRIDESAIRSQYVGKKVGELSSSIDSIRTVVDSIGREYGKDLITQPYFNIPYYDIVPAEDPHRPGTRVPRPKPAVAGNLPIDSIFAAPNPSTAKSYIIQAINKAKRQRQDYEFRSSMLLDQEKLMRRHQIELNRRFTLSFACLIFFFIGAPLGAIIKKGGIGTPLVISVLLFIVYFLIDNMGYKMSRDGHLPVWIGIWLSSAALLPLGVFLTYKAVGDSAVFNIDAYYSFFRRLFGFHEKRSLELKEVIMNEVDAPLAEEKLLALQQAAQEAFDSRHRWPKMLRWLLRTDYSATNRQLGEVVEYLSNSRSPRVVAFLNEYPFVVNTRNLRSVLSTTSHLLNLIQETTATEND